MNNDINEKLVEAIASRMHFEVVHIPSEFHLKTITLEEWRLHITEKNVCTIMDGDAIVIARCPIKVGESLSYASPLGLLHAILRSQYFMLPIHYREGLGIPGFDDAINVVNPFYKMSIDELKVQLDLMGVGV